MIDIEEWAREKRKEYNTDRWGCCNCRGCTEKWAKITFIDELINIIKKNKVEFQEEIDRKVRDGDTHLKMSTVEE